MSGSESRHPFARHRATPQRADAQIYNPALMDQMQQLIAAEREAEGPLLAEVRAERIAQRDIIRARFERDTGQALTALERLDELNAVGPAPDEWWLANTDLWAARVLVRAGRADEAVTRLERAASSDGQARLPALSMRAWMLIKAGRYAEAEQQARDLLDEPNIRDEDMHLAIAKSTYERGLTDEAWAYLREHDIDREALDNLD